MADAPVHILFLADEWGPSKGGLSTINRELAKQCAKLTSGDNNNNLFKVSFLVPPTQVTDVAKRETAECRINLVVAGEGYVGFDDHMSLCFLPESLGDIDVVVGHGRKLGPQAQPIRAFRHCKWVQFVHVASEEIGMYKEEIEESEKKHEIELSLCKAADLVVAVGPRLYDVYRGQLHTSQPPVLHTFTPGIFEEMIVERAKLAQLNVKKPMIILMFGRGAQEEFELKGYNLAAKVIASLGNNYHLRFVGAPKSEHENVKKRFLKYEISRSQLVIRSFCESREKLSSMFCEAHLVIMPSQTEGFGLTALEAISAGVPVLVSTNSGLGEALGGKVLHGDSVLVEPENEEAWKEKIRGVRENHKIRLDEAADLRANYEKTYPWNEECKKLYEVIRKL